MRLDKTRSDETKVHERRSDETKGGEKSDRLKLDEF